MGSTQQFCLKWNNHQSNMLSIFDQLLSSEHFVDVTLACDGLSVRAHKMVLSACSPFFQSLFIQNPCDHPIVILKDIRFVDLKALVQFMYRGEVNVSQDQLPTLLKAAEALKIKGLAEVTNESGQKPSVGSLGVSHNGHHSAGGLKGGEQPSVQAAPSPMANPLPASTPLVTQNALVAAMQQTALKAQLAAVAAAQASHQANSAAGQNSHDRHTASSAAASHESNSNASTPLRQTDSPMSQQNRKRRRKSAGSDKGSGDENSGGESGVEDQMDDTRASDDDSGGEEAEFEPSKLLEQSMTEVRQGHQDNNSSSSDNQTKDSNQADIKPVLNFDSANPAAGLAINPQDPTAVLAFAAAAQAAGASANSADSVAGPSQPTHGRFSLATVFGRCVTPVPCLAGHGRAARQRSVCMHDLPNDRWTRTLATG